MCIGEMQMSVCVLVGRGNMSGGEAELAGSGCDSSRADIRAQVLDGSPWVQSKPVYVLAASTREAPDGMTFTLRTRVARPRLENELTRVCTGFPCNHVISCGLVRDMY